MDHTERENAQHQEQELKPTRPSDLPLEDRYPRRRVLGFILVFKLLSFMLPLPVMHLFEAAARRFSLPAVVRSAVGVNTRYIRTLMHSHTHTSAIA
eukprot:765737-Hanusia_phi.AAC.1